MKSFSYLQWTLRRRPNPRNFARICSLGRPELSPYAAAQMRSYSSDLTHKHVEPPREAEPPSSSEAESPRIAETLEVTENIESSDHAESKSIKPTIKKQKVSKSTIPHETFRELMRHVPRPVVVLTAINFPRIQSKDLKKKTPSIVSETSEATTQVPETAESNHHASETGKSEIDLDLSPIPRAMTLSSFSSLSIKPEPQVTFSVDMPSSTYTAIKSTRRFNIHVLADTSEGARIAEMFSKGNSSLFDDDGVLAAGGDGHTGERVFASNKRRWQSDWARFVRLQKDDKILPYTPASRAAVPVLHSSAILYVLRCVLPRGRGTHNGLIEIGGRKAIVVGNVDDYIVGGHYKDQGFNKDDLALSYVDQEYRKTGDRIQKHAVQIRKHVAPLIRRIAIDSPK